MYCFELLLSNSICAATAWSYTLDKLLPIHVVWQTRVTCRKALRRYAAELAVNATAIAGRGLPSSTFQLNLSRF